VVPWKLGTWNQSWVIYNAKASLSINKKRKRIYGFGEASIHIMASIYIYIIGIVTLPTP
jgi:hypothetical protein